MIELQSYYDRITILSWSNYNCTKIVYDRKYNLRWGYNVDLHFSTVKFRLIC